MGLRAISTPTAWHHRPASQKHSALQLQRHSCKASVKRLLKIRTSNSLTAFRHRKAEWLIRATQSQESPPKGHSRLVNPTWHSSTQGLAAPQLSSVSVEDPSTTPLPLLEGPQEAQSSVTAESSTSTLNGRATNRAHLEITQNGSGRSEASPVPSVTPQGKSKPQFSLQDSASPPPMEGLAGSPSKVHSLEHPLEHILEHPNTQDEVPETLTADVGELETGHAKGATSAGHEGTMPPVEEPVKSTVVRYILKLGTSMIPGSGMLDRNCGVQVAIIGQSGQAISARIYPTSREAEESLEATAEGVDETKPVPKKDAASIAEVTLTEPRDKQTTSVNPKQTNVIFSATGEAAFREGGKAVVCLQAPDIQPISALWLAPLGERWRMSEAAVGVLGVRENQSKQHKAVQQPPRDDPTQGPTSSQSGHDQLLTPKLRKGPLGTLYIFQPDEYEALGSAADALAVELRPRAAGAIEGSTLVRLLEGSEYLSKADASLEVLEAQLQAEALLRQAARQEGMEEYRKLKEWLLLSTSILVVVGTFIANQIGGESTGAAFASGGMASVLFLLKLQRDVDSIRPPSPVSLKSVDRRAAAALDTLSDGLPTLDSTEREKAAQLPDFLREKTEFKISIGPVTLTGLFLLRLLAVGLCLGLLLLLLNSLGGGLRAQSVPKLQPEQMVAAFLGFLTHKISVILAAFRRTPRG